MARRHLSEFTPGADGPLQAKLDEHDTALDQIETGGAGAGAAVSSATPLANGTASAGVSLDASRADHVHATGDVIDQQAVGVGVQEITFVVAGNTDHIIHIDGQGQLVGSLTILINDNATPVTYRGIYSEDGGVAPESTYAATYLGEGGGFEITIHAKTGLRRAGFCRSWSERASDGLQQQVLSVFRWNNTADNIVQVKLRMSDATGFRAGALISARRRKMTA